MERLTKAECLAFLTTLLSEIQTKTAKDTSFVLHIDEAHSWSVPYGFVRQHADGLVPVNDFKHYFFVAFTEVLEELRASSTRVKIVVTATNTFLDRFLKFVSNEQPRSG